MEYISDKVKSYLTYYKISLPEEYYDNNPDIKNRCKIIAFGEDIVRKFKFCILMTTSGCNHPNSYITYPNEESMEDWYNEYGGFNDLTKYDIHVHGGLTYSGYLKDINENLFEGYDSWLGWDYAHSDDYVKGAPYTNSNPHKWTQAELLNDIFQVYENLILKEVI